MLNHAIPEHMRSDNDPEMTSKRVKNWLRQIGGDSFRPSSLSPATRGRTTTTSLSTGLRDECLNGEIFYSLEEAQVIIEQWRIH